MHIYQVHHFMAGIYGSSYYDVESYETDLTSYGSLVWLVLHPLVRFLINTFTRLWNIVIVTLWLPLP